MTKSDEPESNAVDVTYVGPAAVRQLSAADLKKIDNSHRGSALIFSRENGFVASVELGDKLRQFFKDDGDFRVGHLDHKDKTRLSDKMAR